MKLELTQQQLNYLGSLIVENLTHSTNIIDEMFSDPCTSIKAAHVIDGTLKAFITCNEIALDVFEAIVRIDESGKDKSGVLAEIAHNKKYLKAVKESYESTIAECNRKGYEYN